MAERDPKFSMGDSILIQSSGTSPEAKFSMGDSLVVHEYTSVTPNIYAPYYYLNTLREGNV